MKKQSAAYWEEFRTLCIAGKSLEEIGRIKGVSPVSVQNYLTKRFKTSPVLERRKKLVDQAVELCKQGKTTREIAKAVGKKTDWVLRYLKAKKMKAALPPPLRKKFTRCATGTGTFRILADLLNTDMRIIEISKKHGCSRELVGIIRANAVGSGIKIKG